MNNSNNTLKIPEISLVLLVGASSSGKSTFAKNHFLSTEVISSDNCRALISDDENNLSVTKEAFEVVHFLAKKRLELGKLVVIDALNIRKEDRQKLVQLAKDNYALAVAIVLDNPIKILLERHENRTDRNFPKGVIDKQYNDYKQSLKSLKFEGFNYIHRINPREEYTILRQKLWNNKQEEKGTFDIIGDIHGCFDELVELLEKLDYKVERIETGNYSVTHSENRKVIFLGDLTDRGNKSPKVLRLVMDMVNDKKAFCVCGNHDDKLKKYLLGKNVNLNHGLEKTVLQLDDIEKEDIGKNTDSFKNEVKLFLSSLISHYVLDGGKLVVVHAGLPENMHGRASASVRAFCLFGETTGEIDEFGLPVRYNWAKNYRGKATVVYGHTPVPNAEWLNNTINVDTGCVFGGKLTALRYPEKELVSVESKEIYEIPAKPLEVELEELNGNNISDYNTNILSIQQQQDDVLNIESILGKYIVQTQNFGKVIIREQNSVAALEVMSRFAANPKWLIHLPPTMSPPEASKEVGFLEHPKEVFDYYHKKGIRKVVCQEKHMGSRALAIVCKNDEVAISHFGLSKPAKGIIYTRTGRHFFNDESHENAFLDEIHNALTKSNFWERHDTEWVCLDGELLPWSAKAKELIIRQYAAVGSAASLGISGAIDALKRAKKRGLEVDSIEKTFETRQNQIQKYIESYRNYCRETNGIEGLVFAPFHILATNNSTYFDKSHDWHLNEIGAFCKENPTYLQVTNHLFVDLDNDEEKQKAIDWWLSLTQKGGEGMVVKPIDYLNKYKGKLIQPAIKCRGSEYLRIIYGAEYDTAENLEQLKNRFIKKKRELAIDELSLGIESLERFIKKEPLRNIHQCVFGILALESEGVDPRL
ncbi:polynucleotide 3'-phosphatase [Bernardetia litoralis DSM 6794]|uniref:Polynucleotide 3'-phosphatase n=1 Tax=Bernardetia litoralis (strain ATCC 23117 / DSM 6794 / NBRC 15988 / NCIMB 1366 / Fx l1 / Sio-4) TaxID=880071 RepID=I4AH24_BERLS|nr:polynucleotide kinase-phosphatase [Bernardetia litoralis]AFM03259.1 polynucleotide 3'-phosphatase [Bernardetia litoralis DSM 6794]